MLWQENKTHHHITPDAIHCIFKIKCSAIETDHAHSLHQQIINVIPWLLNDPLAAIHLINTAESCNGWIRAENDILLLSKRTQLKISISKSNLDQCKALVGKTLQINDHSLDILKLKTQNLTSSQTLTAKHIANENNLIEADFIDFIANTLAKKNIHINKLLCGKTHYLNIRNQRLLTQSVLLADLQDNESIQLQQNGFGQFKLFGCGIFTPSKNIDSLI